MYRNDKYKVILKYEEFPKINGISVTAVYPCKENKGDFGRDADYWKFIPYYSEDRVIKVKKLPYPFNEILDETDMYNNLSYRKDLDLYDSGSTVDIKRDNNHYYLTKDPEYINQYKGDISIDSDMGKLITSTFGIELEVQELDEYHGVHFDQTYLKRIDGLWYPDVACEGWRWLYGESYVSMKYNDPSHIRVYMEKLKTHYYLEEVEPEPGMEDLILINFTRFWRKRPYEFCNPIVWADTKKEAPNELVRFKILYKKGEIFRLAAILNDKVQHESWRNGSFYKVIRAFSM